MLCLLGTIAGWCSLQYAASSCIFQHHLSTGKRFRSIQYLCRGCPQTDCSMPHDTSYAFSLAGGLAHHRKQQKSRPSLMLQRLMTLSMMQCSPARVQQDLHPLATVPAIQVDRFLKLKMKKMRLPKIIRMVMYCNLA